MRRRTTLWAALVSAAILLAACAGGGSPQQHAVGAPKVGQSRPGWVLNPGRPGYVGVIGSAPRQEMGGRDAQYRVATLKARQELARMIRVQIEATNTARTREGQGRVTQDYDSAVRLRTNEALRLEQAQVVDEWVDPETGDLYLHLVTPE